MATRFLWIEPATIRTSRFCLMPSERPVWARQTRLMPSNAWDRSHCRRSWRTHEIHPMLAASRQPIARCGRAGGAASVLVCINPAPEVEELGYSPVVQVLTP